MYSGRHFVTSCDHRNGLRKCRASTAASDGCSYSPEGSCIGSYQPGKICEGTGIERNSIPEKRKPSMMPGRTRVVLKQRRGHCRCVVPPPCRRPGPVSSVHLQRGNQFGTPLPRFPRFEVPLCPPLQSVHLSLDGCDSLPKPPHHVHSHAVSQGFISRGIRSRLPLVGHVRPSIGKSHEALAFKRSEAAHSWV